MKYLFFSLLALAVLVTALEVVIAQHRARKLFVEIQEQERIHDDLDDLWSRLQLEQSTAATDDRIETQARTKLGMIDPDTKSIRLIIQ